MQLIGLDIRRCSSITADEHDTEGFLVSFYLLGLQVELWVTARSK